jgi:hypothetical protein
MAADSSPADRSHFGMSPAWRGAMPAAIILAFGITNVAITLLRGAKPEWLAASWFFVLFAWGALCLRSLRGAYLILLFSLPVFGARPGDLVTDVQDTLILVTAAVSLWRYPLQLRRPVLWPGWVLAAVALASLLANASTCFYPFHPFHQDNLTRNLFFMFAESWDWTIGISEWWMLVMMLILARGAYKLVRDSQLTLDRAAAALTAGLILTLLVGYLDYYSAAFNARLRAYQLRAYDTVELVGPHWQMPAWLRSPLAENVSFKSLYLNRSWFSIYLLAAAPVAVTWLTSRQTRVLRAARGPLLAACLFAVLLTGAKGALYSTAAGAIIVLLMIGLARSEFGRALASRRAVWAVLLALAATLLVPWLFCTLQPETEWLDTTDRVVAWAKAGDLIKTHPFLGVGFESFGLAARRIQPKTEQPFITAHNFFLQLLTCTGPLGLLALLLLFRTPVAVLLTLLDRARGRSRPSSLHIGWAFMFAMVVLGGLAQHWFYQRSTALLWWVGLALLEAQPRDLPAPVSQISEPELSGPAGSPDLLISHP